MARARNHGTTNTYTNWSSEMIKKQEEDNLPTYRVLVIQVNKDDPEDVVWDLSEFGDWEIPALFKYVLKELDKEEEMSFIAEDEEDEDGDDGDG
jgi:hypothetical protein